MQDEEMYGVRDGAGIVSKGKAVDGIVSVSDLNREQ